MTVPSICIVAGTLPGVPCGIGAYADRLATSLAARSSHVSVVTRRAEEIRTDRPYSVVQVDTTWRLAELPRLRRTISRLRTDVVHVQFPGVGYGRGLAATSLPMALRLQPGRPRLLMTVHEFGAFSRRWRWRLIAGAAWTDLVTAPDPRLADELGRRLAWARVRVRHIPLASNVAVTPGMDERPPLIVRRSPDELVVGFWGFFGPDKGLDDLVAAFDLVRRRRPARLVLIGSPGSEAAYWSTVRHRISELGMDDDVLELGWVPDDQLSSVLRQFDVCALPFVAGMTENRTSYAGARAEGLYVVTTEDRPRFDLERNTSFVSPRNVEALVSEILAAPGRPRRPPVGAISWEEVAELHLKAYADAAS